MPAESMLTQAIAEQATPLAGAPTDFDVLLDRIGDAPFVLLGEATHGSHEFYRIRAELTKRLIREKGFAAIAAEADWPDAYRIDRYVRGTDGVASASDALADFRRFPQWMWRNADVLDMVGWLRRHNDQIAEPAHRVGFYGLDLYSLHTSMAAEQNARVVAHAEEYYRRMYAGGASTWNLRDTDMADTLDALAGHLRRRGRRPKIVVWAHNSHVGDSDAMSHRAERDEITIGHLCRERHPGEAVLVGFTTYDGTVTAASDWGGDAERKTVQPALPGSYEALFHATGVPGFLLLIDDDLGEAAAALHEPRPERAIGVVYRSHTERRSHYFDLLLADQLDAVIHIDRTRAIEPLERTPLWQRGELPETYPTGL